MLTDSARFMRKLHDISAGFVRTAVENGWTKPYFPDEIPEIICHGDAGTWNFVFVDDRIAGLFDFDQAYPGTRLWDLASPLFCFMPSQYDYDPAKDAEHGKRNIKLFFNAYGMEYPANIVEITAQRITTFFKPEEAEDDSHYPNMVKHFRRNGHEWI
jgi:Ser/Thr protein kinase RdoA (MazF antagonist)